MCYFQKRGAKIVEKSRRKNWPRFGASHNLSDSDQIDIKTSRRWALCDTFEADS